MKFIYGHWTIPVVFFYSFMAHPVVLIPLSHLRTDAAVRGRCSIRRDPRGIRTVCILYPYCVCGFPLRSAAQFWKWFHVSRMLRMLRIKSVRSGSVLSPYCLRQPTYSVRGVCTLSADHFSEKIKAADQGEKFEACCCATAIDISSCWSQQFFGRRQCTAQCAHSWSSEWPAAKEAEKAEAAAAGRTCSIPSGHSRIGIHARRRRCISGIAGIAVKEGHSQSHNHK